MSSAALGQDLRDALTGESKLRENLLHLLDALGQPDDEVGEVVHGRAAGLVLFLDERLSLGKPRFHSVFLQVELTTMNRPAHETPDPLPSSLAGDEGHDWHDHEDAQASFLPPRNLTSLWCGVGRRNARVFN